MTEDQTNKLKLIGQIYTPSYPIELKELFSGRRKELQQVIQIISQKGKQLLIYGDRGIGKTSFANITKLILDFPDTQIVKISCSSDDTFESIFHNIFSHLSYEYEIARKEIGFGKNIEKVDEKVVFSNIYSPESITIPIVQKVFGILQNPVIIIDEFDRLEIEKFDKRKFSDLIKTISDNIPFAKFILVGVAEDVSSLIEEHESIERNLAQLHLRAMSEDEINDIIVKGEPHLGIKFDEKVKQKIIDLSSGYPHFTHSLCYFSASTAILDNSSEVTEEHLKIAIQQTIDGAHESLRNSFRLATLGTKQNIFQEVLYAATIAPTDEYGYFQANDLENPLSEILGKEMRVFNFSYHIGKFCSTERGEIFRITGSKNRHRYKFKNPLMRAFIKLKMEQEIAK